MYPWSRTASFTILIHASGNGNDEELYVIGEGNARPLGARWHCQTDRIVAQAFWEKVFLIVYQNAVGVCQIKVDQLDLIFPHDLSEAYALYILMQETIGSFGNGAMSLVTCNILDDLQEQTRVGTWVERFRLMSKVDLDENRTTFSGRDP